MTLSFKIEVRNDVRRVTVDLLLEDRYARTRAKEMDVYVLHSSSNETHGASLIESPL